MAEMDSAEEDEDDERPSAEVPHCCWETCLPLVYDTLLLLIVIT